MIEQIQTYLSDKLLKAGIRTTVATTMKELESFGGTHVGAVIIDKDNFEEFKKSTVFKADEKQYTRVQKLKRETMVNVIIGEYSNSECDKIFTNFLNLLDKGFVDDAGNFVYLELLEADWISDKDSILQSNIAVQLPIKCTSSIYKDIEFLDVSEEIPIIDIEEWR